MNSQLQYHICAFLWEILFEGGSRKSVSAKIVPSHVVVLGILVLAISGICRADDSALGKPEAWKKHNSQGPRRLLVGWTHERWSPDKSPTGENRKEAQELLRAAAPIQNAQIMGWGLPSPMPSPGQYEFAELDKRVALMRETGAIPVITMCCAPDWMKGGEPGETIWTRLEMAPLPKHFLDFATLAGKIAARYPDVKHFLVWNELKGFWDAKRNRWNVELFTEFYNRVYSAIKAARPDALIGGPYVVVNSYDPGDSSAENYRSKVSGEWGFVDQRSLDVIDYWITHKAGADFIAVDGGILPRGGRLTIAPFVALGKFPAVQRWIGERTDLPIWWAELYPITPQMDEQESARQTMRALDLIEASGGRVVLFWNPTCRDEASYGKWLCLWSESRSGSTRPTALATSLKKREGILDTAVHGR